jgi:integrase
LLEVLPEPARSLVGLLVLTGMRIGELLALRWRYVDLDRGVLRVRQTVYEGHFDEPKSKRSNRSVPLGPKGVEILSARKPADPNPEALIFATRKGAPLSRRNLLNRQLKPASKQVGLEGINLHWLRHANATLHDSVGTPGGTLDALLGHSPGSDITRDVYVHSVPADARLAAEKVESLLLNANGPKWIQVLQKAEPPSTLIQ